MQCAEYSSNVRETLYDLKAEKDFGMELNGSFGEVRTAHFVH